MRLIYIANARLPSEKAHGVQITKTCEALAQSGAELELWIPKRIQPLEFEDADIFNYYNCRKIFKVRKLFTVDLLLYTKRYGVLLNALAYFLQEFTFVTALLKENYTGKVVYTRCLSAAVAVKLFKGARVFYEMHGFPKTSIPEIFYRLISYSLDGITTVAQGIEKLMNSGWGKKAYLIPHAVDLAPYQNISREKARKLLKLSLKDKIAVYTGSLTEDKEINLLLKVSQMVKDTGLKFLLIGKTDKSPGLDKGLGNVDYLGIVPHSDVHLYQIAADILVQPGGRSIHYIDK